MSMHNLIIRKNNLSKSKYFFLIFKTIIVYSFLNFIIVIYFITKNQRIKAHYITYLINHLIHVDLIMRTT